MDRPPIFWHNRQPRRAGGPRRGRGPVSAFSPGPVACTFEPRIVVDELFATRVLGRAAVRILAMDDHGPNSLLGWGADDCELLVDAERGVLTPQGGRRLSCSSEISWPRTPSSFAAGSKYLKSGRAVATLGNRVHTLDSSSTRPRSCAGRGSSSHERVFVAIGRRSLGP